MNAYEVLGISREATDIEVTQAWQQARAEMLAQAAGGDPDGRHSMLVSLLGDSYREILNERHRLAVINPRPPRPTIPRLQPVLPAPVRAATDNEPAPTFHPEAQQTGSPAWLVVLVVALLALAGAMSVALIVTTRNANQWQDRTDSTEVMLDESAAAALTAGTALDELRTALAASETDNADLEVRLSDLATEKARTQDDIENAAIALDDLSDVTMQALQANNEFAACVAVDGERDVAVAAGATQDIIDALTADRDTQCADAHNRAAAVIAIADSWSE